MAFGTSCTANTLLGRSVNAAYESGTTYRIGKTITSDFLWDHPVRSISIREMRSARSSHRSTGTRMAENETTTP
jgi:hypothetical protein